MNSGAGFLISFWAERDIMRLDEQALNHVHRPSDGEGESFVEAASWRAIADYYFGRVPIAHAMFRVAELEPIAGLRMRRPVLEIGCGRGEFADAAIVSTIDYGIDISRKEIAIAEQSGKFGRVCCADARSLPFADNSFATAISISVLEHIEHPGEVIAEAYRVLAPGGSLVATIVLSDIHDCSAMNRSLKRLGMSRTEKVYRSILNRIFGHRTLLNRDQWAAILQTTGFTGIEMQRIVPPTVIANWERRLITAWPYRISHRVAKVLASRSGESKVRCFETIRQIIQQWRDDRECQGACLFIHARKPAA